MRTADGCTANTIKIQEVTFAPIAYGAEEQPMLLHQLQSNRRFKAYYDAGWLTEDSRRWVEEFLIGRPHAIAASVAEYYALSGGLPARCADCGVMLGQAHHPGCDHEECPKCRGQLLGCHCLDIHVADFAGLAGVNDSALRDGDEVTVDSVDDQVTLEKESTAVLDGVTCFATKSGVGHWVHSYLLSVDLPGTVVRHDGNLRRPHVDTIEQLRHVNDDGMPDHFQIEVRSIGKNAVLMTAARFRAAGVLLPEIDNMRVFATLTGKNRWSIPE